MMRRGFVGRRLVRTAAVGGVAYAAGHHVANKNAQEAQQEAEQDARISNVEQQQQAPQETAPPPPAYQQPAPPPPAYQQPAPGPTPPPAPGFSSDMLATLKQLGELHEAGTLTDAEFESAKQKILGS